MREIVVRRDTHLVIRLDALGGPKSDPVRDLKSAFTKTNPDFWKLKGMGKWTGDTPRKLFSWRIEGDRFLLLPRAALDKVEKELRKHGIRIAEIKERTTSHPPAGFKFREGKALRPDQVPAVDFLHEKKCALVRGDCGSGKTVILLGAIAKIDQPAIVVVHSTGLMEQWEKEVVAWFGFPPGILGGGKSRFGPITIATQQTIWSKVRRGDMAWVERFGVLAADEIHKWAASTFVAVANNFPSEYRVGASADETRKDGKQFFVYETFGRDVYKIEKEGLVESGDLLRVRMEVVPTGYRDEVYLESVKSGMFCEHCGGQLTGSSKTRRLPSGTKWCKSCNRLARPEELDWQGMIDRLSVDPERCGIIADHIERVLADPTSRILMLCERVQPARQWAAELAARNVPVGLMIGGKKNLDKLRETIAGLKTGMVRVGVATQVADEGIDIPPLTHAFMTCPVHTHKKRLRQMCGRTARPHRDKLFGTAVYFWDEEMFPPLIDGVEPDHHEKQKKSFVRGLGRVVDEVETLAGKNLLTLTP